MNTFNLYYPNFALSEIVLVYFQLSLFCAHNVYHEYVLSLMFWCCIYPVEIYYDQDNMFHLVFFYRMLAYF